MRRRTFLKILASAAVVAVGSSQLPKAPLVYAQDGRSFDAAAELARLKEFDDFTLSFKFSATENKDLVRLSGSTSSWAISVADDHLLYEVTQGGSPVSSLRYPVASDRRAFFIKDGNTHWVSVRLSVTGTQIFFDGVYAHSQTSHFSPRMLSDLNRLVIDESVTSWIVHPSALSDDEIRQLSFAPEPQWVVNDIPNRGEPHYTAPSVVAASAAGTLIARFRADGRHQVLSCGSAAQSPVLVAAVDPDALSITLPGQPAFTVAGGWADGAEHVLAIATGERGTIVYLDGNEVERHSSKVFVGNGPSPWSVWLSNGDSGTTHAIIGYDFALSPAQISQVSGEQRPSSIALFDRGYLNSAAYRIPSLLQTSTGTLLAAADQRTQDALDSPNHIQTVIRRSEDEGQTWEEGQVVISQPTSSSSASRRGASVIDTVLVEDRVAGKLVLVVDRFPSGFGQANVQVGTGFKDGKKVLFDRQGNEYFLLEDGSVTTADGKATSYTVDATGNVLDGGSPAGNIHLQPSDQPVHTLQEVATSYMMVCESTDDGRTWSKPRDITYQVKSDWMKFIGTGPGSGIQTSTGRLVVPVYFNTANNPNGVYAAAVIYSDDAGVTWHMGGSPMQGWQVDGVAQDVRHLTSAKAAAHEATVAEIEDGRLLMMMRNPGPNVLRSYSADGGESWTPPEPIRELPDIFSQPNLISGEDPSTGEPVCIFSNATKTFPGDSGRRAERGRGVLRLSYDGGMTWPRGRVYRANTYVYSSMQQLPGGDIALLWEMEWDGIYFARIPFDWIAKGKLH